MKQRLQCGLRAWLIGVVCHFLTVGLAAGQQPTGASSTNQMRSATAELAVVEITNADGSTMKVRAEMETLVQLAMEGMVAETNAGGAALTNRWSAECKKFAEAGDPVAQVVLGYRYCRGLGVALDRAEGVKWFRKSARQGDINAAYNLGSCYANGFGVGKDEAEAEKWHLIAAVGEFKETKALAGQGDAKAQSSLGRMYTSGIGVAQNMNEAAKWFRRAAEQGDAYAQFNLGLFYAMGAGVPKDHVESYKWSNLSAAQGDACPQASSARANRDEAAKVMALSEIAEAQRMCREFKPHREVSGAERPGSDHPRASGSGFFITDGGYLITNEHVVRDAARIRLVTGAGVISAKVVRVDAANDLALLKAEGRFGALPVAASRGVKLGCTVATIGFPNIGLQGFAPKLAKGEIASLSGAQDDARYFQISVPVQPGNSGGALVDELGNVVGVVSAKLSARAAMAASGALPENVNYAVKSSFLLSFLESVPEVATKVREPETRERKFEDVVGAAEKAAVLVLVY